MDAVSPLAAQVVSVLTPFLASGLKEHGVEVATQLWERLHPKVKERPALQEAVDDVAAQPKDEDAQAALRVQLRKLLQEDPELTQALHTTLKNAGTNVTASGERSVAIGGNASGSTIITGDRNRIGPT